MILEHLPRIPFTCLLVLWMGTLGQLRLAHAEAPIEVAVITPDPAAPLAIRVASELRLLGLQVIFVQQADADTMGPASLEATAQSVGAFAAVRVVRSGPAVEVWIADRTTGKTVIREVVGPDRAGTDADVALGAVELLRASLLELKVADRLPHGEVEPAPQVLEVLPPASPSPEPVKPAPEATSGETVAALGIVVDPGVGGFRPGYGPQAFVARRLGRLAGIEAMGSVVFASIEDEASGTAARSTVGFAGIAALIAPSLGRVQPRVGAGIGLAVLQTQGVSTTASRPEVESYRGEDEQARLGTFHLRTGLALTLFPTLRWRSDATLLVAANEVTIQFAGEPVATWGRPTLLASTALELVVP